MEPIKLFGDTIKLELPDGTAFELPMPTAQYDIEEMAQRGAARAKEASIKAQDEAEAAGKDIPAEMFYTEREWLHDIIEYVRDATRSNGTPGIELKENQAAQLRDSLALAVVRAKKKLLTELSVEPK